MGGVLKLDAKQRKRFLKEYEKNGLQYLSAEACGVTSETVRLHRRDDADFEEKCQEALGRYRDRLEKEAYRRAVEGCPQVIFFKDQEIGTKVVFSDRLMELVLKRHIPEYRDKHTLDVNHTGGVLVVPGNEQSVEDWEKANRGKGPNEKEDTK